MTPEARPKVALYSGPYIAPNMENVLFNLARMVGDSFALDLLTTAPEVPGRLKKHYSLFRKRTKKFLDPWGLRTQFSLCRRYLAQNEPAVLMNVSHPHGEGLVVAAAGKFASPTTVVRMTGSSYREHRVRRGVKKRIEKWFRHFLLADRAYRWADKVLAVGDKLREMAVAHGVKDDKFTVLPQPFDHRKFTPEDAGEKGDLRAELGLPPAKKIILFVGRLCWLKGADRLYEVAREVTENSSGYHFCLVGRGGYGEKFNKLPEESVSLEGQVPPEDIPDYYRAADLLLHPSRIEGLPTVILEALAAELPVIAAPVGEIPNLVDNTSDAPADYVEYIFSDNWQPGSLPEICRWPVLKEKYEQFFCELAASN